MTDIRIRTNKGEIVVELFDDQAPKTVANFLRYVDEGFYAGTIFHRVIPDFMIQGGGFDAEMQQKPTHPPIENEADNGLSNETGTLAMARTSDINSATCQFFINLSMNDFLDHGSRDFGYAVFGQVKEGMDVVETIGDLDRTRVGPHADVPAETVQIETIERV